MTDDKSTRIALFRQREIRKVLRDGEWWFVITDVIAALTDSANPTQYLSNLRRRDTDLSQIMEPVDKGGGSN